jgi:NitT/TauT family transport system substrate-binding protein
MADSVRGLGPRVFLPRLLPIVGLLGVVAALIGCSASAATAPAGSSSAQRTLRLGHFPNLTHATAIVGVESGIFARNLGPDTELQVATFNAGPAAVEALFAGGLDGTYVGPNPTINAYVRSRGEAVRVIAGATSGGASLVVRPGITSAEDLRGKRLATPQLGNTQDVALRAWLQGQGLRADPTGSGDVSITPQDNAQAFESFRGEQIDGAWLPEPWASRLELEGGGHVLVDERSLWPGGQFVTTQLVVRTELLRDQPAVVERLLRGHVEATRYVNEQPQEAMRLADQGVRRLTNQSLRPDVLEAAWRRMSFTNDPVATSLRRSADDAARLGFLNLGGVDLDGIYDLAPLNKVLRETGQPEVTSR